MTCGNAAINQSSACSRGAHGVSPVTLSRCPSENSAAAGAVDARVRVLAGTRVRRAPACSARGSWLLRVSVPLPPVVFPPAPRAAFCSLDGFSPLAWPGTWHRCGATRRLSPVARDPLSSPGRPDPPSPEVAPRASVRIRRAGRRAGAGHSAALTTP